MTRETEIKTLIVEVMCRNAECLRGHPVFLFGSRVTGEARPHSDFDIGVVGDTQPSVPCFSELAIQQVKVIRGRE